MSITTEQLKEELYQISLMVEKLGASPELTALSVQIHALTRKTRPPETVFERLKAELEALVLKYGSLVKFTRSIPFVALSDESQKDLLNQREVMRDYIEILKKRITYIS
jgi:hypothetical protein